MTPFDIDDALDGMVCLAALEKHTMPTGKKRSVYLYDLTGERFGKLTVLERDGSKHKEATWKCKCDCGNEVVVNSYALRKGHTKSCGCFKSEAIKRSNTKHGLYGSKIYITYYNMKNRCYNPNYYLFSSYGGKGITICDEWLGKNGLVNFYNWSVNNGYSDKLSIDRIDNSKGYSPQNCRWATMKQQQNNRTNNHYITIDGKKKTMHQWADLYGISYPRFQDLIYRGIDPKQAIAHLLAA